MRFTIRIFGEEIVFFDEPVHFQPVIETVLLTTVV
jgi:hypothetical protein